MGKGSPTEDYRQLQLRVGRASYDTVLKQQYKCHFHFFGYSINIVNLLLLTHKHILNVLSIPSCVYSFKSSKLTNRDALQDQISKLMCE